MSNKRNDTKAVREMYDVIKNMIKDELALRDSTVLCRIAKNNGDGTYDVFVEPDETTSISGIPALTSEMNNIELGKYVYVYKICNQMSNAFILKVL